MMGTVSGIVPGGIESLRGKKQTDPEALRQVAGEFESLLITQMLQSMRKSSSGGWLGSDGDEAGSLMVEMAEQQLARSIAAGGGLGLADLVLSGIEGEGQSKEASQDPTDPGR